MACSPRARSGRYSTWPPSSAASWGDLRRARAPREELFTALLRQVSEPRRLNMLVVEDVHWADEATIDLLSSAGGSGSLVPC